MLTSATRARKMNNGKRTNEYISESNSKGDVKVIAPKKSLHAK